MSNPSHKLNRLSHIASDLNHPSGNSQNKSVEVTLPQVSDLPLNSSKKIEKRKAALLAEFRSIADYVPETGDVICKKNRQGSRIRIGDKFAVRRGRSKYPTITLFNRVYQLSRIIWLHMTGDWPQYNIDHINGDTWDNSWSNLRDVPQLLNNKNKVMQSNNTSGCTGVSYRRDINRWRAYTKDANKQINIGSYPTFEEAVAARKAFLDSHPHLGFTKRHGE